jgi:23S rRNA (adenine2503-C2)-methyltransferase
MQVLVKRNMFDPRDHAPDVFLSWAQAQGARADDARRQLAAVVGDGLLVPDEWATRSWLPKRLWSKFGDLARVTLEYHVTSPKDAFQKLRFRLSDGLAVETVIIPLHKPGTVSVCVSSQVGCAMGCSFCATARMPTRRNLAAWEIVDQVLQARSIAREQGRRVTGVVFMGMGEPFLNYDRVLAAARLLAAPFGGRIAAKAMTISTVGVVPAIRRYTSEGHRFRLSISLTAATDELRRRLVPIVAERWSISELWSAAREYAIDRSVRVNLSYVCIAGLNCHESDARAIAELVGDTPVRLDLIDVTDPTGHYQPPGSEELRSFRDSLTDHLRQPVARRYSGGADILAACGTLAGV